MVKKKKKEAKKPRKPVKRPDRAIAMKGNQYALGCTTSGQPRVWDDKAIEKERIALEKWIEDPKNYFFTGFLNQRDLEPIEVERMANYNKEFCKAYARAKRIQEERLVELAVSKKGDGNFIKFVLQNKAGWKEKSEISGDAANPLAVIMDRIGASAKDPLELDYDE